MRREKERNPMKLNPGGAFLALTVLALSGCGLFSNDPRPPSVDRPALAAMARDGRAEIDRGMLQSGMDKLRSVLRVDRNSLDALNGLALAHALRGEPEIAGIFHSRASELDPAGTFPLADIEQIAALHVVREPARPRHRLVGLGLYGPRLRNVVDRPSSPAPADQGAVAIAVREDALTGQGVSAAATAFATTDDREETIERAFRAREIRNARNVVR